MRLTRTDAACNTMPSLRDELVNDRMQTKEWRQKIGWIKQMASSCYMDSINVVNDIGGSISPNGTDQFPPLMSCILWEIFWLKGSTWEIMQNTRVSCTHCDTSAWTWRVWWNDAIASSGGKYLWKNMISANASKHSVNYFLALDDETKQNLLFVQCFQFFHHDLMLTFQIFGGITQFQNGNIVCDILIENGFKQFFFCLTFRLKQSERLIWLQQQRTYRFQYTVLFVYILLQLISDDNVMPQNHENGE